MSQVVASGVDGDVAARREDFLHRAVAMVDDEEVPIPSQRDIQREAEAAA